MKDQDSITQLVEMSRTYGSDPDYVIAGGGNSSYKSAERIWVKASGISMASIDADGFVCLDRQKLQLLSTASYSEDHVEREAQVKKDLAEAIVSPGGLRPSVETSMHEVFDHPFVMHTHPTLVNALLCARNSRSLVAELFGNEVIYIPYTDPGYVLFKVVKDALENFRAKNGKETKLIFLENHGVFVGGKSPAAIKEQYTRVMDALAPRAPALPGARPKKGAPPKLEGMVIQAIDHSLANHFSASPEAFEKLSRPFTPDAIVYCKSKYLFLDTPLELAAEIEAFRQKQGYAPRVIALKGKGILALGEDASATAIVSAMFTDVMKLAYWSESFGGPRPMTTEQVEFIDNWEVENYRRQMAKKN